MQRTTKWGVAVALGAVFGMVSAVAYSHGDVTPHPVDTTGLKPLGTAWLPANPYRGNKKAAELGAEGYLHNCAGCHGLNAEAGGMAPDLLLLDKDCLGMSGNAKESCLKDADDYFKNVVLDGKKNSEGRYTMPAYGKVFTQEAVWAVKSFIDARTVEEDAKAK